jgi:hypothetical protein
LKNSRPISASQLDFLSAASSNHHHHRPKSSHHHHSKSQRRLPPIESTSNSLVRSFDSSALSYSGLIPAETGHSNINLGHNTGDSSSVVSESVSRRLLTNPVDIFDTSGSARIDNLLPVTENRKKHPVKLKSISPTKSIDPSSNLNIIVTDLPAALEILSQFSRQVSDTRPFSGSIYVNSVRFYLILT